MIWYDIILYYIILYYIFIAVKYFPLVKEIQKIQITEIIGYNMFGEWTETDCHT